MNRHVPTAQGVTTGLAPEKFQNPDRTAKGEKRAQVALKALETLWFNTGTLCNITCKNCYIASSPTNDRLVYLTTAEVAGFLDEIGALDLGTREIGFTGGEPFMNPACNDMLRLALDRGFEALVLTNAMQPMQRPKVRDGLLATQQRHGAHLTIRVSLDHYSQALHEAERGAGTFQKSIDGINWLVAHGFRVTIAGRTCWGESLDEARAGFAQLFAAHGWPIDAANPAALVLFPEMDETIDVPEITEACWGILGKSPDSIMCATSRMVVKRKGDAQPTVLPCTLLPYDSDFGMGATLAASLKADGGMFDNGKVKLCHPHCAKFCVLGGASCSA